MKDVGVERVRNVGLFGDGSAGKTALAEAMLFTAGAINRLGNAADGNSVMDFEPEETKHRFSTSAAVGHLNWKGHRVNVVDTPGNPNFWGDAHAAIRAVDAAIFVVDGVNGPRVATERLYARARQLGIPCAVFISHLDSERADYDAVVADTEKALEGSLARVTAPVGKPGELTGLLDILHYNEVVYPRDTSGKGIVEDIPVDQKERAEALREKLIEQVAELDDALLEKYLEEGTLGPDEVAGALRNGIRAGAITPVLGGSLSHNRGVDRVLDVICECFPSPAERAPVEATDADSGETVSLAADPDGPFAAQVFKTVADPYAGRLTVFRVWSGKVSSDSNIQNASRRDKEHVGALLEIEGKKHTQVPSASAGDIVAVAKLKHTHTGDSLANGRPIVLPALTPPASVISFAITAKTQGEEDKIGLGLHRLVEEDPSLRIERNESTGDLLLSCMGQMHAEVTLEKLARKFKVEAELHEPHVPYRETIKRKATAQGKYKKQSGGRGQYGDCHITLEPNPGGGWEFVDKIVGGAIPRQYIPAVEKGVLEAMERGYLAGFPMVDVKMTLFDGSYHDVDSSEMAFKVAGSMGFKKACETAAPCLLEPIMALEVTCPEECLGDVMGDLNSRRGRVGGMEAKGAKQVVKAQVPMAEVLKYAPDLRSITSGRGSFTMEFDHYAEVPPQIAQKVVEAHKREAEEHP